MITVEIVDHVANLARLRLSEEERQLYAEQLSKIIGYFDELKEVNTEGVIPLSHPLPVTNVMRDDEPVPSPGHDVLLKTAPDQEGPFFKVPKIGE